MMTTRVHFYRHCTTLTLIRVDHKIPSGEERVPRSLITHLGIYNAATL